MTQVVRAATAYYGDASYMDDVAVTWEPVPGRCEIGYAQLRALIRISIDGAEQQLALMRWYEKVSALPGDLLSAQAKFVPIR